MTGPTVMWFRRDLRLADNPALLAAVEAAGGDPVVPLFVLDDRLLRPAGPRRRAFLAGCLQDLYAGTGGALVVRHGDPAVEVPRVATEAGATAVYAAADFGPYGSKRDDAVEAGVELRRVGSPYAVDPGVVLNQKGEPYKVFTPFYRAWRAIGTPPPRPAPASVEWATGIATGPLPNGDRHPDATEAEARRRLDAFAERVGGYAEDRDRVDLDATSRLSPYLKFGLLHPRQVLAATAGSEKFRTEIAWREFAADVLWHNPRPAASAVPADRGDEADRRFEAWARGRTGYPVVDAGMRQLAAEGWLPNRVRMIVASFLVKDLHLDWRRGAGWFMSQLVDGDLASNRYNWQWVAGTGVDPSPWFRVFNPVTQGKRHDPHGDYVRRWVSNPVEPIVDHTAERAEALARYQALRSR